MSAGGRTAVLAVAILLAAAAPASAAVTQYSSKSSFLSATGATNATGALPALGANQDNVTLGALTFDYRQDAGDAAGHLVFEDRTPLHPGVDLAHGGPENMDVKLYAPTHAFGFDFVEPQANSGADGCNAPCVDSTFDVTLKLGTTTVGTLSFNAANDQLAFQGWRSTDAFDTVEIRERGSAGSPSTHADNEYFGQFYSSPSFVIDEFRLYGTVGDRDQYIELRNLTPRAVNLNPDPDDPGAPRYVLRYASRTNAAGAQAPGWYEIEVPGEPASPNTGSYRRQLIGDQQTNTVVAADGLGNWQGTDPAPDGGVELYFRDCDAAGANCRMQYQDGVGFTNNGATYGPGGQSLGEGTLLTPLLPTNSQFAFVRENTGGRPIDTNNNANDFRRVSSTAEQGAIFGWPGPQNREDPSEGSTRIGTYLVDPTVPASSPPNREVENTTPYKTLKIRRMVRNDGSSTVVILRYRIPRITTDNSPGAGPSQAILRWIDAPNSTLTGFPGKPYDNARVQGIVIDGVTPEGGWNSESDWVNIRADFVPGESLLVEFRFQVIQGGSFHVNFNAESAPDPPP